MLSSQDRNNVNYRPAWWLYGTGIALYVTGMSFIVSMSLSPSGMRSWWSKVGFLLVALSIFAVATIPGALLAFHHPSGAAFRSLEERRRRRRIAHPRLYGLAEVWAGLVLSGSMGAILFVPGLYSSPPYWMLAVGLVALAPMLALALFDRRR